MTARAKKSLDKQYILYRAIIFLSNRNVAFFAVMTSFMVAYCVQWDSGRILISEEYEIE